MPSSRAGVLRGAVAAALGAALVASAALTASPALASTDGTGVVINEAYLKGGSANAPFNKKFVELYNGGSTPVDLSTWSIQYRKADGTGAATSAINLTGTIGAKDYYLVQFNGNAATGAALPGFDQDGGAFQPSGTNGTLWLAKTTAKVDPGTGAVAGNDQIADLLGYGTSATFEGAGAATTANSNSTQDAMTRNAAHADSDSNSADFTAQATPTPQTSGGTTTPPTDPTDPPTDPTDPPTDPGTITAIKDIQGTTDSSPLVGQTVTTQGVVTATYSTGGFNGYTIQTEGTGGAIDFATHTASDALYVYSASTVGSVKIGDLVQVTGAISEFKGSTDSRSLTEITVSSAAGLKNFGTATAPVTPATVGFPATDAQRESLESMLVLPQGDFTVSNTYSTNQYAEIGLASGTTPLITPTEIARPGTAEYTAAVADNAKRGVILDDGASINFLASGNGGNKDIPLPYLTKDNHISVGAAATFTSPVIFDWRNNTWKFQPTTQLTAAGTAPATFSNVLTAAPKTLNGDVRISSFNVLNYFPTTGDSVAGCTSAYTDRAGNKVTVNSCGDAGPRGAWDAANLKRQQDKIVTAINKLTADVVSLEEIENSVKFGKDRDFALKTLTDALNAAAGTDEWAYVPSPAADKLPLLGSQDVIRTAFIYKKAVVETVGDSVVLTDSAAFTNARQPLAQGFKVKGASDATAFLAIVNHFKSKGSGSGADADQNDGQGASNASRVAQAKALLQFASDRQSATSIKRVFLLGDFNAYGKEDPIQAIVDGGYTDLGPLSGKYSYSFSGQSGSLDHILTNAAGKASVTGTDIWNINSGQSIAYEYSRYNYNATNFYTADQYRASDHDPVIVGLSLKAQPISLNLLNINDFHGRVGTLNADGTATGNAVKFAGTIEKLRAEAGESNTLFLSDGDNIGASEFASSTERDQPTIDILNALDLKASAVGNHEFDGGFSDLTDRVIGKTAKNAKWDYLGANVYKEGTETPVLPEYSIQTINGLKVGIIGAVTEETKSLVSPAGIQGLTFGDPVAAVNRVAAKLTDGDQSNGEADILIAEYHEGAGAGTPEKATLEQEVAAGGAFATIVKDTSAKVGVIFTGHTHKQYAWDGPIPGDSVNTRPIIQTGNYGENIGQVKLTIDPDTKKITGYTGANVARIAAVKQGTETDAQAAARVDNELAATYPRVAAVKKIVDAALANAITKGSVKVGSASADVTTAFAGGNRDDRASESALGNLVADSLVASLKSADRGGATIGVVNPGGLRADLAKGDISFAQANAVLPFLNNLNTVTLTGAQFKEILEQQWQTNADGSIPSRPFLKLGLSKNVAYTYDPTAALNSHITSVTVDGKPLDPAASYTIGTFSFLATGGDNFRSFTKGTVRDSGLIDRDAWIEYLTANQPVSPDFARRSAAVTGAPKDTLDRGAQFTLNIGGLDTTARQGLDNTSKGAPLITELTATWPGSAAAPQNIPVTGGAATAMITVPADAVGATNVVLTAKETGAKILVPVTVKGVVVVPPTEPTTPPVGADDSKLTIDLQGKITIDITSAKPGSTIKINVGIEFAGTWVSAWLHSTPVALGGWQQVASDGTISVTIPADAPAGEHRIAVQDADGDVIGWSAFTVLAANPGTNPGTGAGNGGTGSGSSNPSASGSSDLAATGIDATAGMIGALALLLAGAALVVIRRRRAAVER
ncbi:ExeM/NucH family extracellular endonuclease [Schumannella soli]|uniref:ExeM/NucH family extracellular endonuclease n=1 Tax=Schumannella soli TaxID=2590779 RepID=A0A506Y4U6_9MICO|nr:ExeM/NucH family extracellular endonuclease [Schumannella soli]TPW77616.1 ExeM/NucH family extracellular endonuclease [Schumannella soli]